MHTQEYMINGYLPIIETEGNVYRKVTIVRARPASVGEKIITVTSDGKETENVAKENDWLVENNTEAREEYLISDEKFRARHEQAGDIAFGGWLSYMAKGKCQAIVYEGDNFEF